MHTAHATRNDKESAGTFISVAFTKFWYHLDDRLSLHTTRS